MNAAETLVEMLIRYDTDVVFGLPGDTSVALYDALRSKADAITHVMARDERSAAFMADVYARLTGKPGICEGPSGGGATYMLPGIVEAHTSSVAIIALTTDNPIDYEAQGALTALDQPGIYKPVTKWTTRVKCADTLPRFIRRAFRMATSGRPGAVHLSLPKDVLAQGISAHVAVYVEDSCKSWPAYRTRPPADAVDRVSRLIHESQRPVIVAGGGVVSSGAHTSLSDLAHRLGIPVVTTINGKGAIAENTALSVGVIGANGGRPSANRIVQEADLVLFLGCKSNYVDTDSWRVPPLDDPPKIVQIDIDTSEIGNNYPVDEGLCGDVRLVLADLLASLGGGGVLPVNRDRWLRYVSETKAADQARMAELADCTDVPLSPYRVVKALQQELPEDAILICDPGTPTPIMAAQFELPRAGRSFISPRGQGGLGYAIPGAVGARLGYSNRPVVALSGDGSFAMAAGELATVARVGGPTVIMLFHNQCYGWIKALQDLYHDGRYFNVDFTEPIDYTAIAQGFGLQAARVTAPKEVRPTLRRALEFGGPFLIQVDVAPEHCILPPVPPWHRAAEHGPEEKGSSSDV